MPELNTTARIKNSYRNITFAMAGQFLGLIISFISRMIFIRTLGETYLGVNGLFSNILSLLSLAELGFASAITFHLYQPLANGDEKLAAKLMNLYGSIYKVIGIVVIIIGLSITPFVQYLIKKDEVSEMFEVSKLQFYFLLFLINSSISYFWAYKRSLIIADQKQYINSIIKYSFFALLNLSQSVLLIITKNFILFLCLQILITFLENMTINIIANKRYPLLKEYRDLKLTHEEKLPIYKNVKAMLFHKIGGVAIIGSTSIILSAFVGIISVGIYSNYFLIITALNTIINQIFESIHASVGNLNATNSENRTYEIFKPIFFANGLLIGLISICLYVLFNYFIELWLGANYLFEQYIVSIIVINFYITNMRKTVLMFRDALGLFWYDRFKPLVEAALGISLSIIFSHYWGIFGVLLGFTIATLLACFVVEPYILYKYGFKNQTLSKYFIKYFLYTFVTIIALIISNYLSSLLYKGSWITLVLTGIICVATTSFIYLITFFRSSEFRYIYSSFKNVLSFKRIK